MACIVYKQMKSIQEKIRQYKVAPKVETWDLIWRMVNAAILKLSPRLIKSFYGTEKRNQLLAYHILYDPECNYESIPGDVDHEFLFTQFFRSQVLCETLQFDSFQIQKAKQCLIRDIIERKNQGDFWYLLEAVVQLSEAFLARYLAYLSRNEQGAFSLLTRSNYPVNKLIHSVTPPRSRKVHSAKIEVKDYSRERLTAKKLHLSQFASLSQSPSDALELPVADYPKRQPEEQPLPALKISRSPAALQPRGFLRNYYLSILMQQKPPVNHQKLRLDMSKITFDQGTRKPQKRTLLFLSQNNVVQEEEFNSDEEEEYQQVIEDIKSEYQLPESQFVTNRTETKVCLTPQAINRIRKSFELRDQEEKPIPSQQGQLQLLEFPPILTKQPSCQSQHSQTSQKSQKSQKSVQSVASQVSKVSVRSQKSQISQISQRSQKTFLNSKSAQPTYFISVPQKPEIPKVSQEFNSAVIQEQTLEHEVDTPKMHHQESKPQIQVQQKLVAPKRQISKKFQEMHRKLYLIFGGVPLQKDIYYEPEQELLEVSCVNMSQTQYSRMSGPKNKRPRKQEAI